jgi:hypothetical protein
MAQAISLPSVQSIVKPITAKLSRRQMILLGIGLAGVGVAFLLIFQFLNHPTSTSSAEQPDSHVANSTTAKLNAMQVDTAFMNAAPANPVTTNHTTTNSAAPVDLNVDALMPGHPLPNTLKCGSVYTFADSSHRRDCLGRGIAGFRLVQITIDADRGIILVSTVYTTGLTITDLIAKWGKPIGLTTANRSHAVYWQNARAYTTSSHLRPTDTVDFITFDTTAQHYQPWTDFQ